MSGAAEHTSRVEMEHPSYPGHHDAPMSEELLERLGRIADVMIPPETGFPAAASLVTRFVSERVDATERDTLERILEGIEPRSAAAITTALQRLETDDPVGFLELRNWVYYGYYTSGSVVDALREAGSDYHGAPQPFGYRIEREAPVPVNPRGSYQRTEEVRRVLG
ncbi:MAG TPA: hypothetical protein VE823_22385 [Geodermatophilus sp.]|nr:hypothetical protein [Geodermatophilus sp.]